MTAHPHPSISAARCVGQPILAAAGFQPARGALRALWANACRVHTRVNASVPKLP
jgi:hypothetical protein